MITMNLEGKLPKPPRHPRGHSQSPQEMSPPWARSQQPPWQQSVQPELIRKGEGPLIAGKPTVKYQVKAKGEVCSENYFSQSAADVEYVKDFFKAMFKMANSRKMKGMPLPSCFKAHDELNAKMMKLGIPMKTIFKSKQGNKVANEIIRIKTDTEVLKRIFEIPKGYEEITEKDMIKQRQEEMRKRMKESQQQSGSSWRGRGQQNDPYNTPPQNWRDERDQQGEHYMPR
jgi:hypothetical protein